MYTDRFYRSSGAADLHGFRVTVMETDLYVMVDPESYLPGLEKTVEKLVLALRYDLESYFDADPEFKTSLQPRVLLPGAPLIAQAMAHAANIARVGPMAAVAGAFAEFVGRDLMKSCSEVIVENGGDIFVVSAKNRLISVYAGHSPFSGRLAVEIPREKMPMGICTSSGTVGPSLSLGKADAAVIIAKSAALADAAASAAGNAVKKPGDVKKGIEAAKKIKGVLGAVLIKDDQLAAWGDFNIVPLKAT